MPAPKLATFPAIRKALKFYQVASVITGVMLLLLLIEMIVKYTGIHRELFLGGSGGFLWFAEVIAGDDCKWYSLFVPGSTTCSLTSTGDGVNLSLGILVAHGWFYVLYLFACFRLWTQMRWGWRRGLVLALGGVVPFLSFVLEYRFAREVKTYLAAREAEAANAEPTTFPETPATASEGSQ